MKYQNSSTINKTKLMSNFEDEDEDRKFEEFTHPTIHIYVCKRGGLFWMERNANSIETLL